MKTFTFSFQYRPVCGQPFENKINQSKLTKKITEHPLKYSGVLVSSSELSLALFVLMASIILLLYIMLREKASLQKQRRLHAIELELHKVQKQDKHEPNPQISKALQFPLTVILGLVDTMKIKPPRNIDQLSYNLESSCLDIIAIMNQSKAEPWDTSMPIGMGPPERDFIELLRQLTESFQIIAINLNISLGFYSTEDSLKMIHSKNPVRLIYSNILTDFLKYTPTNGNINVQVSTKQDHLQLHIHNIGSFTRELNPWPVSGNDPYTTSPPPHFDTCGTLAYTDSLVRLLNGRMQFRSKPKSGLLCEVQIPINPTSSQPTQQNEYSLPLEKVLIRNRRPSIDVNKTNSNKQPTILIIEDNVEVAIYLKESLKAQYDIQLAIDDSVGATMALQILPDLIITDLMSSPTRTTQFIGQLKNDARTCTIPVIRLMGKTVVETPASQDQVNETYLTKPFMLSELHSLINRMLKKGEHRPNTFTGSPISNNDFTSSKKKPLKRHDEFTNRVLAIVSENYSDDSFGLTQLSEMLGLSRSQLFRKMKAHLDMAPADYIRSFRLQQAKKMLENSQMNVSEVAWKTGYKNTSHFSTSFLDAYGYSPSDAARG